MTNSVYHEGELAMQTLANVSDLASRSAGAIADRIPDRAIQFIEQQPMVVIGSMDALGQVWASVVFGQPGFMHAIDVKRLELDRTLSGTSSKDPLWSHPDSYANVGILFIELASRRRLRVNGRISKIDTDRYRIEVKQAYPNCPKYIQRRCLKNANWQMNQPVAPAKHGTQLNSHQIALIAAADTFFVASAHPEHGLDASHRGGQPGFVQILDNMLLRIPDYTGNSMFNTLGNVQFYPHAGLVFIDFEANLLLQLTGEAQVLWLDNDPKQATGDTQRFWQFKIITWRESIIPYDLDWELLDSSSFNPTLHNTEK